jgi:hypothetical protein
MTQTAKFRKGLTTATITLYPASATVFVTVKGLSGASTAKMVRSNTDQAAATAAWWFDNYATRGWTQVA